MSLLSKISISFFVFSIVFGTVFSLLDQVKAANLTVTKLADTSDGTCDADCSLREAVAASSSGDIIHFASGLSGTITVSSAITLPHSVTILGPGVGTMTVSAGGGAFNIFYVNTSSAVVAISGLTISHSDDSAIKIDSADSVTLTNVTLEDNTGNCGPAISHLLGDLIIDRSTIQNNDDFNCGVVDSEPGDSGTLTVTNSRFYSNTSSSGAGGLYVWAPLTITNSSFLGNIGGNSAVHTVDYVVAVTDSKFIGNTSNDVGGGLWLEDSISAALTNVTFSGNQADGSGGAMMSESSLVTISNATFSDNVAAEGGAIASYGEGTFTIENSTFLNNTAPIAAAVFGVNNLTIRNSSFSGNTSTTTNCTHFRNECGIVYNWAAAGETVAVENSTFSGNTVAATTYGGILLTGSPFVTVKNSTFTNNTMAGRGGAVTLFYNEAGNTASILNSTFSNNTAATAGGALYVVHRTATVKNTIITNTVSESCAITTDGYRPSDGVITSSGYNIESHSDCGFASTGDLQSTDAMLSSLANNGGVGQTMALKTASPAVDAANDSSAPATDQRGTIRPQGSHSDIGAFELIVTQSGGSSYSGGDGSSGSSESPVSSSSSPSSSPSVPATPSIPVIPVTPEPVPIQPSVENSAVIDYVGQVVGQLGPIVVNKPAGLPIILQLLALLKELLTLTN